MKKIKLFNRDGANLQLVKTEVPHEWRLVVDKEHEWVLEHMRIIGKDYTHDITDPNNWEAIDPAGGPFISIGDKFEDYTVTKIISLTILKLEKHGNIE